MASDVAIVLKDFISSIFDMTVSAYCDCHRLLVILIGLSVEDTTWPASSPRYVTSFEP